MTSTSTASASTQQPPSCPHRSCPAEQSLVDESFAGRVGNVARMKKLASLAAEKKASRDKYQALGVPLFHSLLWGDMAYVGMLEAPPTFTMAADSTYVQRYEFELPLGRQSSAAQQKRFVAAAAGADHFSTGLEELIASITYAARAKAGPPGAAALKFSWGGSKLPAPPVAHPGWTASRTTVTYVLNQALKIFLVRVERAVPNPADVAELGAWEDIEILRFLSHVVDRPW